MIYQSAALLIEVPKFTSSRGNPVDSVQAVLCRIEQVNEEVGKIQAELTKKKTVIEEIEARIEHLKADKEILLCWKKYEMEQQLDWMMQLKSDEKMLQNKHTELVTERNELICMNKRTELVTERNELICMAPPSKKAKK